MQFLKEKSLVVVMPFAKAEERNDDAPESLMMQSSGKNGTSTYQR